MPQKETLRQDSYTPRRDDEACIQYQRFFNRSTLLFSSESEEMNNKSNIITFPQRKKNENIPNRINGDIDFEDGEFYCQLLETEDYPRLVRYCEQIAAEFPDDLYAQYHLGNAYFLNGEYDKAIILMNEQHKKYPWNPDFHYVILDSLFAAGKNEDDFIWIQKPTILRMSKRIVDACYEFLKYKRKPRSLIDLYTNFISEGYLLFSEDDLLEGLLNDQRFVVDKSANDLRTLISVVRKKRK
jgi:tetratricopeptide (TPR) repeat protein